MSEESKVLSQTAKSEGAQSLYEWSFTYKDGSYVDKYLDATTKNKYLTDKCQVQLQLTNVLLAELYNKKGECVVSLKVPSDAVVFQRRRGGNHGLRINFYDRWHSVTVAGYHDTDRNCWIPEHNREVPEVNYDEVYLIGYRKREADKTITVKFMAVYPETRGQPQIVEEHDSWGAKPWLFEPEWYLAEQV